MSAHCITPQAGGLRHATFNPASPLWLSVVANTTGPPPHLFLASACAVDEAMETAELGHWWAKSPPLGWNVVHSSVIYRMALIYLGCLFSRISRNLEAYAKLFNDILRLRPPKGIITRTPRSRAFSVSERECVKLRQRVESCQIQYIPGDHARSRELARVTACTYF